MNLNPNILRVLLFLSLLLCLVGSNTIQKFKEKETLCVNMDETVRARRKSCLLRPDSGPCRADILSWYFDAKQRKCYRFFWGGCQGNGNRYVSRQDCINYCYIDKSMAIDQIPHFCSLPFAFGTCFGEYHRWAWDNLFKICRRRLYSGCGGNQNNFETQEECTATCLTGPKNTMNRPQQITTCIPFTLPDNN